VKLLHSTHFLPCQLFRSPFSYNPIRLAGLLPFTKKDTRLPYKLHPPRTHKVSVVLREESEIFNMLFGCRLDKLVSRTRSLFFLRYFKEESSIGRSNYNADDADFETQTRDRSHWPSTDSILFSPLVGAR
jgi:hypothetical protein